MTLCLLGVTATASAATWPNWQADCAGVTFPCWVYDGTNNQLIALDSTGTPTGDFASDVNQWKGYQSFENFYEQALVDHSPPEMIPIEHELAGLSGDGASIADYYNATYAGGNLGNDPVANQIVSDMGSGGAASDAAVGEGVSLADGLSGGGLLAGLEIGLPEVGAAVAIGATAYSLGNLLFGSPSTPSVGPDTADWSKLYPGDPFFVEPGSCPSNGQNGCHNLTQLSSPWHYVDSGSCTGSNTPGIAASLAAVGDSGSFLGAGCGSGIGYASASYEHSNPWGWDSVPVFGNGTYVYAYLPYDFRQGNATPGQTPATHATAPSEPADGRAILGQLSQNPTNYSNLIGELNSAVQAVTTAHSYPSQCAAGQPGAGCVSALGSAGFTNVTVTHLTEAQSNHGFAADAVVTLDPPTQAPFTTPITVTENPDTMPIEIPQPAPNELATDYENELKVAGFLDVSINPLSDTNLNPAVGPNEVAGQAPAPGNWVDPATQITVDQNPADSPQPGSGADPGGSSGAPSGPTEPGIDVSGAPTPCNVFPFGVPCWIANQLNQFTATAAPPSWTIGLPAVFGGNSLTVSLDHPFGVDLSGMMAVARPVLLVLATLGVIVWLAGMAMGGGTGGGGGGGEGEE